MVATATTAMESMRSPEIPSISSLPLEGSKAILEYIIRTQGASGSKWDVSSQSLAS